MNNIETCPFCTLSATRIIAEDDLFWIIRDGFPVTTGHTLMISKRHAVDFFALNDIERARLNTWLITLADELRAGDSMITGFNIGMNCGVDAGQTVMHFHAHLIPRRHGDCENPRGGIRGVIAEKQSY